MPRPREYDNLIKTKALEEVLPTPGAIEVYLVNANTYLIAANRIGVAAPAPIFTLAYEGLFLLVQSVLEYYGVRTKDAGRNLAIQRACSDLKMSSAEFSIVTKAHERRNATTYRSPFPPVSRAEAMTLVEILEKYLPVAYALTQTATVQTSPRSPGRRGE